MKPQVDVNGMRKTSKELRLQEVIKFCNAPHTIKDIMDHCGIVYNTAWRYVNDLIYEGKLKMLPSLRQGSALYVSGKTTAIPTLYNVWMQEHIPLMFFAETYNPVEELASAHAANSLPTLVVNILREIDAGNLQALAELKDEVIKAHALLISTAGMFEQLIKNNDLWSAHGIAAIARDSEFNKAAVATAFDRYLTHHKAAQDKEATNGQ